MVVYKFEIHLGTEQAARNLIHLNQEEGGILLIGLNKETKKFIK